MKRTQYTTLCIATMLVCAGIAHAQPVSHDIRITTPGNITPIVEHIFGVKAYARTDSVKDGWNIKKSPPTVPFTTTNTETRTATAGPSSASAVSNATITTLQPGLVLGSITATTTASASLGTRSAYAASVAYSKMRARGRKEDRSGNIKWRGQWKSKKGVTSISRSGRRLGRDPIVARLIDNTLGTTVEWMLYDARSEVLGGEFVWENDVVSSDACELVFELEIPGVVTTQSGTLRLVVEGCMVTEAAGTGMFASAPMPTVGTPTGFSFALPSEMSLDYDLGGDPANDLEVELDLDNAHEAESASARWENGRIVTDLGDGFEHADTSEVMLPETTLGFSASVGAFSLADDVVVVGPEPKQMDMLMWPFYQTDAPVPTLQGALVQVWNGPPGQGGQVIAQSPGNVLIDVLDPDVYRITEQMPQQNNQRHVYIAEIDMLWVPMLNPGQYWIELTVQGDPGFSGPWSPPAVNHTGDENALIFDVQQNQWFPVQDFGSGIPLDFAFNLFCVDEPPCYADCDENGVLNILDYICFGDAFAAQDPYADCDGNGMFNIFDYICFGDSFAAGCP